jgi:hypothetical protein
LQKSRRVLDDFVVIAKGSGGEVGGEKIMESSVAAPLMGRQLGRAHKSSSLHKFALAGSVLQMRDKIESFLCSNSGQIKFKDYLCKDIHYYF